jgi:ribosomal protein S18 acetylase RimI-like enzyme
MTADSPPFSPTPLHDLDYNVTKRLYQATFSVMEDKNFAYAWKHRNRTSSVGIWEGGALLGAVLVRGEQLEYIFVSAYHQGCGLGKILLESVLDKHPTLYLIPVKDPRVIRWYETYGFRIIGETITHAGTEICMVRSPPGLSPPNLPIQLLPRTTPRGPCRVLKRKPARRSLAPSH